MFPMLGKVRSKTSIDYEFETAGISDCFAKFKVREEHLPKKIWDCLYKLAKKRYKLERGLEEALEPGVRTGVPKRYYGLCKTAMGSFISSMKSQVGKDGINVVRLDVQKVFFHLLEKGEWELIIEFEGVYNKK